MADTEVELKWLSEEDLKIKFNSESMDDLVIAKTRAPREKSGGEARRLLAASVAECVGSTLLFLLKWAKIGFKDLRVTAEVVNEKDAQGREYIGTINIGLHVGIPEDEETIKKFERVRNLINRGCFVSRSLERGIKVNYSLVT